MFTTIDHQRKHRIGQRLEFLATRLRWPQYRVQVWEQLLTDEDRLNVDISSGKIPEPIFMWAGLRCCDPVVAALYLAREVELVSDNEYQRLLNEFRAANGDSDHDPLRKEPKAAKPDLRQMVRSTLLGKETHQTDNGVKVNIAQRDGKYIARGSIGGQQFGVTLGKTETKSESELRQLLVSIENSSFVRPSERHKFPIREGTPPRLSIEQLCNRYYADVRATRGEETANTYLSRLRWLIRFAETKPVVRRWPLALTIDREFVLEFRKYLYSQTTTPNGHPGADETPASPRLVYNVLDCSRTMFNWALKPVNKALPLEMVNPFTADLVGNRPKKDPLRKNPLPMEDRITLVGIMDEWELCQFALPMILPLRPEDYCGFLISDVNFSSHELELGSRFGDRDFNKNRLSFRVPYPPEIAPILRYCIAGRPEGVLLRRRKVVKGKMHSRDIANTDELAKLLAQHQQRLPAGKIQTEQDLKKLCRKVLKEIGGISINSYRNAFRGLVARSSIERKLTPMNLRAAITTELKQVPIDRQVLLYVTGHELDRRDIINEYAGITPRAEMDRYYQSIAPLISEIVERGNAFGIS